MRKSNRRNAIVTKVSTLLDGVVGPIFQKRGYHLAKLICDWPQIVGEELARNSDPDKIITSGSKENKTLLIRVDEANVAALIYFRKGVLIEKISQYFGYKIVSDLKVKQVYSSSDLDASVDDIATEVSEEERNKILGLKNQIAVIDDDKLSARLLELAKAVILK